MTQNFQFDFLLNCQLLIFLLVSKIDNKWHIPPPEVEVIIIYSS